MKLGKGLLSEVRRGEERLSGFMQANKKLQDENRKLKVENRRLQLLRNNGAEAVS